MSRTKIIRSLFIGFFLASGTFSSFFFPSVRADTSAPSVLSPATISRIDGFIVKVQALRPKYPSDTGWNIFLDNLNSKIGTLKPQYIGNTLILTILNRLSSGVIGLKVSIDTVVTQESDITQKCNSGFYSPLFAICQPIGKRLQYLKDQFAKAKKPMHLHI